MYRSRENDNREVWSDRKLLFWFAKDPHWVEITNEVFSPKGSYHKIRI